MYNIELNSKWENITSFKDEKGYKALRVTSTCIPDLFIAVDGEGYRCLLLYLPNDVEAITKGKDKSKLLLSYLPTKGLLLIKLKDYDFIDLFNDLIVSIYSKISLISEPVTACEAFISTFYKWSDFFEDNRVKKLSEDQLQGLFGELFVLLGYLSKSKPANINSTLASWKGLYDAANDFEFDTKNIEVKTIKKSKPYVKISSEFQLEKEHNKGLELFVVTVQVDLTNGDSIYDLLLKVRDQINSSNGDLSILYHALNQKRLTIESLKQYNNHRFKVIKTQLFDTSSESFPKLIRSNVLDEISDLRYKLRISDLDQYLIEMKRY